MQYYDFITLENKPIDTTTELYLVQLSADTYTIKAISEGLEQLPNEPEIRTPGYWLMNPEQFLANLADEEFQKFFTDDFLTPNRFTLDEIRDYFNFAAVKEAGNYREFNPNISSALRNEWIQNLNWDTDSQNDTASVTDSHRDSDDIRASVSDIGADADVDDIRSHIINRLLSSIPFLSFEAQELRDLPDENIITLQKVLVGLDEGLFTGAEISFVNIKTLVVFFSFDVSMQLLREGVVRPSDIDGIDEETLTDLLTNHLDDLRNYVFDCHQYVQITNVPGSFDAVKSEQGQIAVSDGLLTVEQIIDFTDMGKISEILTDNCLQGLRNGNITTAELINMSSEEIIERVSNRTFQP